MTELEALRRLRNEVAGLLGTLEAELREVYGATNVNILKQRLNEADTARLAAEQK